MGTLYFFQEHIDRPIEQIVSFSDKISDNCTSVFKNVYICVNVQKYGDNRT